MDKERKFLFDVNIFDAPEVVEDPVDLPPPPPSFSEEELSVARDVSFEKGRQQGVKEATESREQFIAQTLDVIANNFSRLFAAETLRDRIYEKESLKLAVLFLDILFPSLNRRLGTGELEAVIEKTLIEYRKTKEITITVPEGLKGSVETLISRIRSTETDEVRWRVVEDTALSEGDGTLEWSDGGAVRDSLRAARSIRTNLETLLGDKQPVLSESLINDIVKEEARESAPEFAPEPEKNNE